MPGVFVPSLEDGVAVLDWRNEAGALNLLDEAAILSLEGEVERSLADSATRGILITSSQSDLGGGADIGLLQSLAEDRDPGRLLEFATRLHALYRRIETGGKPVAAATPGTAVGGVFEMMLACHRRFAATGSEARIGLPETRIGLFPAAGGTTRLVRLLGLERAGPLLLEGRLLDPQGALEAGLVDEVAPLSELRERAVEWLRQADAEAAVQPWDRSRYRLPGGGPYSPGGAMLFAAASALAGPRSRGNYLAIDALLAVVYEGALVPFETALGIERRWVARVLRDGRSQAMMRTNFVASRALAHGCRRPASAPARRIESIGVIGAGLMGAGIAYRAALSGLSVVLLDRDEERATAGAEAVARLAEAGRKRGRLSADSAKEITARVRAGVDFDSLAGCEIAIEAVYEDPALKARVLAEIARVMPSGSIIATNTSTLPVSDLARAVPDPERFVGIHFFSPVERMQLVEVIRGKSTGDVAVGRALDLVAAMRRTPIIVNDARFFYANRCIIPYGMEALRMIAEGVNPVRIERAALSVGMPLGCLQLLDETSLALNLDILDATRSALGDSFDPGPAGEVLQRMVRVEKRPGRKSGAGFYAYRDGKRIGLWPGLREIWPPVPCQPPVGELGERLLMVQALEAVRAREEGVLADIREGDVGAVLGWGFAPWSGGPFSWLDSLGGEAAVAACERLVKSHGSRFTPPALLQEMAARGGRFHEAPRDG